MTLRRLLSLICLATAGFGLAACDKCGSPISINAPSIQKSCGANGLDSR